MEEEEEVQVVGSPGEGRQGRGAGSKQGRGWESHVHLPGPWEEEATDH